MYHPFQLIREASDIITSFIVANDHDPSTCNCQHCAWYRKAFKGGFIIPIEERKRNETISTGKSKISLEKEKYC